jgi:hypothetical protein
MIETIALLRWENADTYYYLGQALFGGYLIGSIPFGLIFAWIAGAGDVRKIGSGNIGATNVLRTGKTWAAAATLICDALKGYIAVVVAGEHFGIQIFRRLRDWLLPRPSLPHLAEIQRRQGRRNVHRNCRRDWRPGSADDLRKLADHGSGQPVFFAIGAIRRHACTGIFPLLRRHAVGRIDGAARGADLHHSSRQHQASDPG